MEQHLLSHHCYPSVLFVAISPKGKVIEVSYLVEILGQKGKVTGYIAFTSESTVALFTLTHFSVDVIIIIITNVLI